MMEGYDIELIATVQEETEGDVERAKLLCQLAESLDDGELLGAESELQTAADFPSLSEGTDKATAKRALARIKAVREFKAAVEEVDDA